MGRRLDKGLSEEDRQALEQVIKKVTRLASARTRQDLAASGPSVAVPRGGPSAEPEHLHRGPDLAALARRAS
jgi:hypothetical protein